MKIDFENITNAGLDEIQSALTREKKRREEILRPPVYFTGGRAYEKLVPALIALRADIDEALSFEGGEKCYFDEAFLNSFDTELLSLKIKFWHEAGYKLRPDTVWG